MRSLFKMLLGVANPIFIIVMIVLVWQNTHWSVAVLLSWMAINITAVFWIMNEMAGKIRAAAKKAAEVPHIQVGIRPVGHTGPFGSRPLHEQFAHPSGPYKMPPLNQNICEECMVHGKNGVRLGSQHMKSAPNCHFYRPPEPPKAIAV